MFRPARTVSIVLTAVAVVTGLLVLRTISREHATTFYARALSSAGTREKVAFDGAAFVVINGSVSRIDMTTVTDTQRQKALALAYAQESARRSPLLGIAGTDPKQLQEYVSALRDSMTALAAKQTNAQDRQSIDSLYPISFLDALATLEQARLDFLKDGTDAKETAYRHALGAAIAAGDRDAHAFQNALSRFTAGSTVRFVGLNGTQTPALMDAAIASVITRMSELRTAYGKREQCFDGIVSECSEHDLDIPTLPDPARTDSPHTDREAQAILSIISDANQSGPLTGRNEVVLPSSTCISSIPGPYHFYAIRPEVTNKVNSLIFLNELDFTPITASTTGPVLTYLKKTYGISYSRLNPMNFYTCPVVGEDLGMIRAVISTSELAVNYPDTSNTATASNNGSLDLASAIQYLRDTVSKTNERSSSDAHDLLNKDIELMLMFNEKSAGLDNLVGQISDIIMRDIRIADNGVPFDVTARTLFLTHSAFPSLFLTQNDSAGTTPVQTVEQSSYDTQTFLTQLVRYVPLESDMPRALVVQNVRAINLFEQNEK